MSVHELVDVIERETESINELLSYLTQQREAVVNKDLETIQDLIKLLHSSSLEVYKYESLRDKAAATVAAGLDCENKLNVICEAMGEDGEPLRLSGEKLEKAVRSVGAESKILKRLVEEGQKFYDMMLSEIRRFERSDFSGINSMDLKG
ncbi:MAG: flagellar protein FlgN [Synergistaceae bacterium]|nr:flagellar protein FlgN [Synergistaceae bacterium]